MYGITDLCILIGHDLRAVADEKGLWAGYHCLRCEKEFLA